MRPTFGSLSALAAAAGVLLASCDLSPRDLAGTDRQQLQEGPVEAPPGDAPARATGQSLGELAERSRNDLAARLNTDPGAISVVEARHVVWPDSSAGCPLPGYDYLQVRTEGVLIRLEAGGRTWHYHGGPSGPAALCEKPSTTNPPSRFADR